MCLALSHTYLTFTFDFRELKFILVCRFFAPVRRSLSVIITFTTVVLGTNINSVLDYCRDALQCCYGVCVVGLCLLSVIFLCCCSRHELLVSGPYANFWNCRYQISKKWCGR